MAKPTKPTVPAAPLRSNPSTFSAQAETFLAFISPFATYMDESSDFVDGRADAALAAALGGDLPALTGNAGKVLRVNAGETAGEFFTLGTASLMADSADADLAVDPDAAARRDIVAAAIAAAIPTALNATGSAPMYACRAWVNFNGTGTVAIRASGNVSSITDNGTGNYTVNFATALPDANYAMSGSGEDTNASGDVMVARANGATKTTAACRIKTVNSQSDVENFPSVEVMFFR